MKKILIVIPTRNRLQKLKRALNSIPDKPEFEPLIVCDGDQNTYNSIDIFERKNPMSMWLMRGQNGSAACRNKAAEECEDGYLYATDDIEFKPNAIEHALQSMNNIFHDDDGVIGFHQEGNKTYHPTGVALVGQKFLQRYPNKRLFYPKYFHFCCQEVHELAIKYNKFYLDKNAAVYHYHPQSSGGIDKTHKEARVYKTEDFAIRRERKEKGIIWGDSDGKGNEALVDRGLSTLRRKTIK